MKLTTEEQINTAWNWHLNPSLQLLYKDFSEYAKHVEEINASKNAKQGR